MAIDIIGVFFIIFYFVRGYAKGIIVAVFSLLSIVLGFICALKFSPSFGQWLITNDIVSPAWGYIIAYSALFLLVVMVVRIISNILHKTAKGVMLGGVNMMIGAICYTMLGLVLWSTILLVGTRTGFISRATVKDSYTYKYVDWIAPWTYNHGSALLPFAENAYTNLDRFLNTLK